jgi:hypothetical protein
MAVGRHLHVELLARDLLVVEAEAVSEPRELGLIRRLLHQDENQKGEESKREGETDDPANEWNALQNHDEQCGAHGVQHEVLPFGNRASHD